ncbi:methyltransferase domain-containing protein [Sporosarcina sp. FSL W7-1349]|uniref:class I SAM-dependent methyltransferase n=1 Tax=Sporosarcina sp. FSL W7-1349 TaxID=2921561 RepID=UPI0030FA80F4
MTKTHDSWNAHLYDGKHRFISNYGTDLIEVLAPRQGEKILDLGCGTGDLANRLHGLGVDVIGVDKSENMVTQAKKKYPAIPFEVRDATNLGFTEEFDAVFSNAVLHWIRTPKEALQSIQESLQLKGRFVAEFGAKGNVQTITDEIQRQLKAAGYEDHAKRFPWYFPSIAEYTALMEDVGFQVELAQHFERPTPLEGISGMKNWIEMFGSSFFEGISEVEKEKILDAVVQHLKEKLYIDGVWIADYQRIRIVGIRVR